MEDPQTPAQLESQFLVLLEKRPLPTNELLTLIHSVALQESEKKADEWAATLMQDLMETFDFPGLYLLIKDRAVRLTATLKPTGLRDTLKKSTHDRLIASFVDSAAFGDVPLEESFRRIDLLLSLKPGTLVIDPSWGLGTIKRMDDFYKRATIDFQGKPGHSMTFATVCGNLVRAPHDHLFTLRHNDPEGFKRLVQEKPGEIIRIALRSFGDMPVAKIEDILTKNDIVPPANWKSFWDAARKALKNDPLVIIPAKRADSIQLRSEAESYGDTWFDDLGATKDPIKILELIAELETSGKLAGQDSAHRGVIEERLNFAIKGAYNTDAPLYARLAATVSRLGFLTPPLEQLRAHLWDQHRYIKAAESLSVRDVAAMTTFLLAEGETAVQRMLDALSLMPFNLLNETLSSLKGTPAAAAACRALLTQPKAPPTLVNWIFRNRKDLTWQELPPLIDLLNHAILLIEGKLSGEALRMQNTVKQLFEQNKWFDAVFQELSEPQRELLFERIQASTGWDPSTHRSLIGRMLKLDPALVEHKKSLTAQPAANVRWTSWRSLTEHQALYKKLVEVELPKNSHDIAVARSYGDLRENFEYQAAKDLQRQLLQRQAEMQLELKQVKGSDFHDAPTDKVGIGTTVVLRMADGSHRSYTVLGEWDSDSKLNIISNKTRLALVLEGKKSGDSALIPAPGGEESAQIEAVLPLDENIRAWIKSKPEEGA